MEELIEVKLTRREIAFIGGILGSTSGYESNYADHATYAAGETSYDTFYRLMKEHGIAHSADAGPNDDILHLSKNFTVKNV